MNRTIKFRGKRPNSGKWIYGYLFEDGIYSYILSERFKAPECSCEVIPETVGRLTGYPDKEGSELYSGDVVKEWFDDEVEPDGGFWVESVVAEHKGCICLMEIGFDYAKSIDEPALLHNYHTKVIKCGNIHEPKQPNQ